MFNLTQHPPTPEQVTAGVGPTSEAVQRLLTFDTLPTTAEIRLRAVQLATLVTDAGQQQAMMGGAPYLMGPLERALAERGFIPFYSFSQRESVEVRDGDTVTKRNVFRHVGFVPAALPVERNPDRDCNCGDGAGPMADHVPSQFCG